MLHKAAFYKFHIEAELDPVLLKLCCLTFLSWWCNMCGWLCEVLMRGRWQAMVAAQTRAVLCWTAVASGLFGCWCWHCSSRWPLPSSLMASRYQQMVFEVSIAIWDGLGTNITQCPPLPGCLTTVPICLSLCNSLLILHFFSLCSETAWQINLHCTC